jgi:hypothetical protein
MQDNSDDCGLHKISGHSLFFRHLSAYFKTSGISSPKSSNASRSTCLTADKSFPPVICRVPATIWRPSGDTIRRYPHQLPSRPADHRRMGALNLEFDRSQVLKAAGTKYCSAICWMTGSLKMLAPASLHPCFCVYK